MSNVTIIGAGQQGTSMALDFAAAGYDVQIYDNAEDTRNDVRGIISGRKNLTMRLSDRLCK